MLRAGVIGLGIGTRHAATYAGYPACQLAALCDLNPARLAEAARSFPEARTYERAEDLLRDPGLDVVSIASYDDRHYEQTAMALAQGKHVFVEKPLCQRPEQLDHLRRLLEDNPGLSLSSNLVLRSHPRFVWLHDQMGKGAFGKIFHWEMGYNYGRLSKITQGWRGDLSFYSVMQGGGVHMIDLLLWLSGEKVERVAAMGNRISSAGTRFAFDDMVAAILTLQSGATAKVSANFGCVMPHFHELTVYGQRATFVNQHDAALFYTSRDMNVQPRSIAGEFGREAKEGVLRGFLDSLATGSVPPVRKDEVMDAMSVCLAIDRALETGQVQAVEY